MTEYQSTLVKLLSRALFRNPVKIDEVDWSEVLKEAKSQAIVKLVESVIDMTQMTLDEAKQWKQSASADLANNIRVTHNHTLLHEWMRENDIP